MRVPSKTFPTEIVFAEGFQWLEKDVLVNGAVKIFVDLLRSCSETTSAKVQAFRRGVGEIFGF